MVGIVFALPVQANRCVIVPLQRTIFARAPCCYSHHRRTVAECWFVTRKCIRNSAKEDARQRIGCPRAMTSKRVNDSMERAFSLRGKVNASKDRERVSHSLLTSMPSMSPFRWIPDNAHFPMICNLFLTRTVRECLPRRHREEEFSACLSNSSTYFKYFTERTTRIPSDSYSLNWSSAN